MFTTKNKVTDAFGHSQVFGEFSIAKYSSLIYNIKVFI